MKIILSHPTGNSNVRAVAEKLAEQNNLLRFHTSIAIFPDSYWTRLSHFSFLKELKRRTFKTGLKKYISTSPWNELSRMLFSKLGVKVFTAHETGLFSIDKVYHKLDSKVANTLKNAKKNGVTAVYAYEDGALETFIQAKQLGLTCIYDLPIAYWETGRKLMQEEAARLPAWAKTLGGGILDSEAKLERKRKELELADIVIGPGSFVLNSLPEWSLDKIKIVSPFGSPKNNATTQLSVKSTDKPLRVLFVGSMGQRKGLGDLFEAFNMLKDLPVELVVLGSLQAPMEFYTSQLATFTYEPGRSHDEVLKLMRTCDVFCLPSIVEGRALVMQEAMSQGLPIIITPNTGGEDLVIEGETGFLVPIRSPKAIVEKIKWFVENRDRIPAMGEKAAEHAQNYTWDNYSETIIGQLKTILK
ncbi:glycosyltransferase family 4 protein [Flavobacterium panacagri]|uniref:glycosyltransferase family 4 protein n=1 Tax=Flavobacterium panacagri TaxID=3034146 RepID=UPI0025A5505F|nr:glycosyltransferase family 4 protein [Flavobacterium panacagri]